MGLIMLLDAAGNSIMLLTLVGAAALTLWDCRGAGMSWRMTMWWVSVVLLIHVVGYLALKLWLMSRPNQEAAL